MSARPIARGLLALALLGALLLTTSPGRVAAATDHVTACTSSGPGSLADTVAHAAPGDTVLFDLDCVGAGRIRLRNSLAIYNDLTIDGTGHAVDLQGDLSPSGSIPRYLPLIGIDRHATVRLTGLTVEGARNRGVDPYSCGIDGSAIGNGGTLTLERMTLINNAGGDGGAILNGQYASLLVLSSTIAHNRAWDAGGGIYSAGSLTLINTTVADNLVSDIGPGIPFGSTRGGGIATRSGSVTAINSTIVDNRTEAQATAEYGCGDPRSAVRAIGGGLDNSDAFASDVRLINTIVAGNRADDGPDLKGPITSGGSNLVGTTRDDPFTSAPGDIVNVPARLQPLGNYGGPTQTAPPRPGSPAIGGGNPAICATAIPGGAGGVDQRGLPRGAARCFIGAVEAEATSLHVFHQPDEPLHPGLPSAIQVEVISEFGGVLPTYTGTVSFTSSDKGAKLPGSYTFTAGKGGDNGAHTFTVVFTTPGKQTLTVRDATGKVAGTVTLTIASQ